MGPMPKLIFEARHGSRAYNLAHAGSDHDYKGIVVGPRSWYLGIEAGPEQVDLGPDHVRYEIRKLLRLALKANPTVLEVLFTRPADHLTVHPAGARLLAARESLLSRRAQDSFGGYALGQLKRIRSHRRWLLSPPKAAPRRADFGLPDRGLVPRDQLMAAEALLQRGEEVAMSPNFLLVLERERGFRQAQKNWQQYQGWLKNRNPARAELEARFGYDCKHAMHLIRLLRMAGEILDHGEVRVWREDREELMAIRRGAWSYDQLVAQAEQLAAALPEKRSRSRLPEEPDRDRMQALCIELIELCWKEQT